MSSLLSLAAGAVFLLAASAFPFAAVVPGLPPADTPAGGHPLAGTWELVAADDVLPDGTRVPAYGAAPKGLLIVDAQGRYSLQLFRTDRARFAAGDKRKGTPAEFEAAVLGMSSHVGWITVDAAAEVLTFHISLAAFPNWEGTEQRRRYELVNGVLTYRLPAQAGSSSNIPLTSWRRVEDGYRP
ncbi:MAG: lipocalin-like domain-containing protein [Gemmatimonadetes bacterium]|nr:lipocalin-like domain-containing protein [Gemmatimonadota bacterium]